jgi:hypothetical protein
MPRRRRALRRPVVHQRTRSEPDIDDFLFVAASPYPATRHVNPIRNAIRKPV